MIPIQSLPPPPTEMLKEADKEHAEYMRDMLRIALSIKQFRIHAKPILSQKLAETPSAKCFNDRIKSVNYSYKFLGSSTGETCIQYYTRLGQFYRIKSSLFESIQFTRDKKQEKYNKKEISRYYDLYHTSTYNTIAWRKLIIERIVYQYFKYNHQIKRKTPDISLEKMCALAIAFIMIRKTQRWETVCVGEIERFLETKQIMNYCLKYSPKNIIKNRKLLVNVDNSWNVQNY